MVDLNIDKYAHRDSPLHRWDARFKIVSLTVLIFSFSFVQDLRLLPALIIITFVIYFLSGLPFRFLVRRLRYPGIFLLAVAIVLPLFSGSTVLFQIGPITIYQEGLLQLLIITVKFVCILTLAIVMLGTAPFLTSIKAMRSLRLSPILTDMLLMTYRYIFEIGYDLRTMETAMRMRNFRARRLSFRGLNTLASLSGTLLVRSYERSERIYRAMIVRGYGHQASGNQIDRELFHAGKGDVIAMVIVCIIAALIVAAQVWLQQTA